MTLPTNIRVLGLPWQIAYVDVANADEPDAVSHRCHEQLVIQVGNTHPLHRQAYTVWWQIYYILHGYLVWGKAADATDEHADAAIARALWAAVRDNRGDLRRWFGLDGDSPEVADGVTLQVLGEPVPVRRPHRIPGRNGTVLGLWEGPPGIIHVRNDLVPHLAAEIALHELLHATVQPIHPVGDMEDWVKPMGIGLAQVFFDNPAEMRALLYCEESGTAMTQGAQAVAPLSPPQSPTAPGR